MDSLMMAKGEQLVSVIIPTFNRAKYIRQAVESVLDQTHPHCEVIVVDDGSTDETRQVLEPHMERICYVHQENQGLSDSRNHGLRMAQGDFVVFLDADDFFLPDKLTDQLACFAENPSLGAVHSGWRFVNQNGGQLGEAEPWQHAPRLDLETWIMATPVLLGAMLFRREWLARVDGFDPRFRQSEASEFVLRLALLGCKTIWLQKPTICIRQHDNNMTRNGKELVRNAELLVDTFFARPEIPDHIRNLENKVRYYREIWFSWVLYRTGYKDDIVDFLQSAFNRSQQIPMETVVEWMNQFAIWFEEIGGQPGDSNGMLPYIREAAKRNNFHWQHLDIFLPWWTSVWQPYVRANSEKAAKHLSAYTVLSYGEFLSLVQSSITKTPTNKMVMVVDRLWQDICKLELVLPRDKHIVTSMYLTCFGQLLLAHNWEDSWLALKRSLCSSNHPKAFFAWVGFLRNTLKYYLIEDKQNTFS